MKAANIAPMWSQWAIIAAAVLFHASALRAPAWYAPQAGRWLNRDPVGEKGGPNIYAAGENDPANKSDALGLWTQVYRTSGAWAQVCADSDQDTWDDLARRIALHPGQAQKWAQGYEPSPKRGKHYGVPNTVFVDIGPAGWNPFDHTWTGGYSHMVALANDKGQRLRRQGYLVRHTALITRAGVLSHLTEPSAWGYVFAGHGEGGHLHTWPDPVPPGDHATHHRLGLLNLFACETGYTGAGRVRVGQGHGPHWAVNVAPGGEFLYFPGWAFFWSEPTKWVW